MGNKILLILIFQLYTLSTYSQLSILERQVKIDITEGAIEVILKNIAENGYFSFSYNQEIPEDKIVKLSVSSQSVKEFLDEIFDGDVFYIEYSNKLIIKKKPLIPEKYLIRGRVIDSVTKEPIPGVTVIMPESDPLIVSVSNADGYFQFIVPAEINLVNISCVGYAPEVIQAENNKSVKVELKPYYHDIEDVQIMYYTKPRSGKLNASVSKITSNQLKSNPVSSIENSLQGNISGVQVVRNSGMPGASLQVKIRGVNSLINSEPSYYLDGIYLQKTSLYSISPHDIDKIEIIKDASGTAIYGATAGNGVVLLHSKKVENNKLAASFNYYYGIQEVWKTPDLMSLEKYTDFFNKNRPGEEKFDTLLDLSSTNWMNLLFKNAKTEDFHFSISGGNNKSTFYFSSGYFNQEAIIKNLSLKRYNFTFNSSHNINNKLTIGHNLFFSNIGFQGLKEGSFLNDYNNPILGAMIMPPNDSSGNFLGIPISEEYSVNKPYDDFELTNNIRKNYAVQGQVNAIIWITPSLNYKSRFGFETYFQDNTSFTRESSNSSGSNNIYTGYSYNILDLSYDWQQSLEYAKSFNGNHTLNFSVDYETGKYKNEWMPLYNKHYVNSLDSIVDETDRERYNYSRYHYKSDYSFNAGWASIKYNFRNGYFLNTNIRYEKVSYYDKEQQNKALKGIYPSISLGWIFTSKSINTQDFLNYGKLRYGWGRAGNSPRINYSFFANMMRDMEYIYAFQSTGDITHSYEKRQTNERFYLEAITSHNIGVDLGFVQNRIFLTVEYFSNHQQIGASYPLHKPKELIQKINNMSEFGIIPLSPAELKNKGVDVELTLKHTMRNFSCNLGFNFSHLKNEIISVDQTYPANENIDILILNIPGEAAGSFCGYKIDRLFTIDDYKPESKRIEGEPYYVRAGDYKFEDVNKDGEINYLDKAIIGNPFPDFTFGFFCDFQFYNFDLSALFQGSYGNEIFNATKMWLYNPYGLSNWTTDIENSYLEPVLSSTGAIIDPGNTNTDLHRYDFYNRNQNLRVSDFYIEDGSYIRLKNIMLGFTFNQEQTRKFYIQKLRLFICAQNLYTWSRYSGMDPEVGGWGVDCGTYPQPRMYIAGINVEF